MFGGVPISVTMPPRMAAKASGISVSEGGRPAARAARMSSGIKRARAATLLTMLDSKAPTPLTMAIWVARLRFSFASPRVAKESAPEFSNAREATSTSATMTTAGLEKPENASSEGTKPINTARNRPPAATRSCRKRPQSSITSTRANRMKRLICSTVMCGIPRNRRIDGLDQRGAGNAMQSSEHHD